MAKNNRAKWAFSELPDRRGLSAEEIGYWRNSLSKVLKIGLELEFNLPEKKNGTCKGDSNTCPCIDLKPENKCWQQCVNKDGCVALERNTKTCNNSTATCEDDDCADCAHFSEKCYGTLCPNFVSFCYVCTEFQVDCKSCKFHYDPLKSPEAIREHMKEKFKPNNTYGQINDSGVHSVVTDGSLLGKKGAEIVTVGRRVDYWEFYKMAKNIIDLAKEKGAYLNERCSTHMHALASYYGKVVPNPHGDQEKYGIPNRVNEMERSMPEVILANLHQLVRRYQNAMTWMMMGLSSQERMTRWEKFRVSVLPVSAVMNHMQDVMQEVSRIAGGNKYGWINYNHLRFDSGSGDISRFHVEFRAADGMMSPSALAALGCMYYALIIKAVDLSRYGVLEVGDNIWLDQANRVKEALLNNTSGYDSERFSDTRELHNYYEILTEEALDLVHQLKPILIKIGPAYEVLEKLAERPCALRRIEGQSWEEIEDNLAVIVNEEDKLDIALTEIMTLNQVSDCKEMGEWVDEVGRLLREDPGLKIDEDATNKIEEQVMKFVDRKKEDGRVVWSTRIGAPIMV